MSYLLLNWSFYLSIKSIYLLILYYYKFNDLIKLLVSNYITYKNIRPNENTLALSKSIFMSLNY